MKEMEREMQQGEVDGAVFAVVQHTTLLHVDYMDIKLPSARATQRARSSLELEAQCKESWCWEWEWSGRTTEAHQGSQAQTEQSEEES